MVKFKTESVMEFDSMDDLKKVIALMPWTPEQKEQFFSTGEFEEDDEAEFDGIGAVETSHKFSFTEE